MPPEQQLGKKSRVALIAVVLLLMAGATAVFISSRTEDQRDIDREEETDGVLKEPVVLDTDAEGLKIEVLKRGSGDNAAIVGDIVFAHYVGKLEDGTVFDSSRERGEPLGFGLGEGRVIRGWDLGLVGMKVGEIRRLTIASELAYGENGTLDGSIPPNATLIFEVELIAIAERGK